MSLRSSTFTVSAVLVALSLALAGCGGGSNNSSSNNKAKSSPSTSASSASASPSPTAGTGSSAATAQITQNWEAFFNGKTPPEKKISLLQNGQRFAPVIQSQSKSTLAQGTSAKVSDVSQTSATSAKVTYSVLINGSPALSDQTGQAMLIGGVWKVSDQSFCALLSLQGGAPSPCPRAAPIPSPTPSS